MIKTVYIKAKSKKEVNAKLAEGVNVICTEYSMFNSDTFSFKNLPDGTVIKIFEKYIGGQPYAKAYGNKKGNKIV